MIKECPHCHERYMIGFDCKDFIHRCNSGNEALDQDDVVVIGDWEDFSGSGTKPKSSAMLQGSENALFGTDGQIQGVDIGDFTIRGNRESTHRQRQHYEYVEEAK